MNEETKLTPVVDPDEMLPQVEKMIYSQAWKCSKQYPVDFEEAKSEAYNAFMKACYDYKPERGQKFSTWCYYWVWTKLKDMVMKRSAEPIAFCEMTEELCGEAEDLSKAYCEGLTSLSTNFHPDAKRMLDLLVDAPKSLTAGKRPTPLQLMSRVKKQMINEGREKEWVDQVQDALGDTLRRTFA